MNDLRIYANFLGGRLDADAASGAVSLSSPAFAAVPVIDTTNHMLITLDPDGLTGEPLVLRVTAHTAAATTVTVDATGSEGTTARALKAGTDWVHSVVKSDFVSPFVKVYRSTALNIATGGVDVQWDGEDEDLWGFHDNVTNNTRLTIPASCDGVYVVAGAIHMNTAGVATKIMSVYINKNGTPIRGAETVMAMATVFNPGLQVVSAPVRMVAGDYFTIGCYQDDASRALNITKSAFWCQRLSA